MAEAFSKAGSNHLRGWLASAKQPGKDAPQRRWPWICRFALRVV